MAVEAAFDHRQLLDELRCRPIEWLWARRDDLVRKQRQLHAEELAVTAVLDERQALDDSLAQRDGVSLRSVQETVETARALAELPEIAAVAYAGGLSSEQLSAVTRLADTQSDPEWAVRAPNCAPVDLARLARNKDKPTAADAARRHQARELQWWWQRDAGMLAFRGRLADVDGALFETALNQMIERQRPAKGEAWDSRAHRGADALVELCRNYADVEAVTGPRINLVVEVPLHGPAEIVGIPLPDGRVEQLRANASITPVLVDDQGLPIAYGRTQPVTSPRRRDAVMSRDGHCRIPGCLCRTGLQEHHLEPRSWGGNDSLANIASVCAKHHPMLIPNGSWALVGNPNLPDGLRLVRHDKVAGPAP